MSVIDVLEADLKALAFEAGRSLSAVKEAAAIAITRIHASRDSYDEIAKAAAQGRAVENKLEDVVRPFLLACNHKTACTKLIVVALGSIQRLLHADVLDQAGRKHVMHVLIIQSQRAKPIIEIEVKILQTIPALLTPRIYPVSQEVLFDAVGLCCKFHATNPGLTSAALTQVLTQLFDSVETGIRDNSLTENHQQNIKCALVFLEELCLIVGTSSNSPSLASGLTSSTAAQTVSSPGRLAPFFRSSSSSSPHAQTPSSANVTVRSGEGFRSVMPKTLALELLETILSNHSALFMLPGAGGSFSNLLQTKVCPVIFKGFGGRCDWRLMVRLMRTLVVLLCELRPVLLSQDIENLLNLLLQTFEDGGTNGVNSNQPRFVSPLWHRVLTMETLNVLCSRQELLEELQQIYPAAHQTAENNGTQRVSLFVHIVQSLCFLVGEMVAQPSVAAGVDAIAARQTKGLELLSEEQPPSNLNEPLVTLLAAECLASVADGMALSQGLSKGRLTPVVVQIGKVRVRSDTSVSPPPLLTKSASEGGVGVMKPSSPPKLSPDKLAKIDRSNRRELVKDMLQDCWKPVLRALAQLLKNCNNEKIVQFLLKAYMSMTNTCGILGLVDARDAFIMSLCTFSLPNWHSSAAVLPQQIQKEKRLGSELQAKHLQALKALFNIAHGLGSILGTAWHIVLETFEQLDHIMFCVAVEKKLTTSGAVHVMGMGPSPDDGSSKGNGSDWHLVDDEMAIVESMLRFLFNSSKYLDDEALIHMQTALTQLSFTVLAHTETMRNVSRQEVIQEVELPRTESNGWISSTISSLADVVSSVAYDGSDDEDAMTSDADMPELHINDRIRKDDGETLSNHHRSSSHRSISQGLRHVSKSQSEDTPHASFDGVLARATYRNPPFAIEKLVETTKLNVFRIDLLWGMTQTVLSTVASKSDPKLRLYGVEAMEDLVTTALLYEICEPDSAKSEPTNNQMSPVVPEDTSLGESFKAQAHPIVHRKSSDGTSQARRHYPLPRTFQVDLVEGFSLLFKSQHADSKEATVQSIHRMIGTCGYVLDEAWGILIAQLSFVTGARELEDVPENVCVPDYTKKDIHKLIPIGFKAVELIVDDFLPALSFLHREQLARCIRAFGDQEPHVNISLTAITMLWSMCDQIQKECPALSDSTPGACEEIERSNALLLYVFKQLYPLSLDPRPEVRNCAVRTLCSNIVTRAPKLTMDSWHSCSFDILFPLLDDIISRGSQAPTEQVHGEVLGRLSGERTRVHHSLDTLEKQWRETIVTAVQGATRVVRATIQFAGHKAWSTLSWDTILCKVCSILRGSTQKRVSLACTRALQDLVALVAGGSKARFASVGMQVVDGALVRVGSTHSVSSVSSRSSAQTEEIRLHKDTPVPELWEMVWTVYMRITRFKATNDVSHPKKLDGVSMVEAGTDIIAGLGELFKNSQYATLRTPKVLGDLIALLTRMLTVFPANSKHITSLERAVLATIDCIPPIPDQVWPILFNELRVYMGGELGVSAGFQEKTRSVFVELYEKHAPSAARALVFHRTITDLKEIVDREEPLLNTTKSWDVVSLRQIFKYGLRSLSTCRWTPDQIEDVWMNLLYILQRMLLVDDGNNLAKSNALEISIEDGLKLLDVVMDEARPLMLASCVPQMVQDRLLELLRVGMQSKEFVSVNNSHTEENESENAITRSSSLSRVCLDHIMTLSSVSTSSGDSSVGLLDRVLPSLLDGVEQIADVYLSKQEPSHAEEDDVVALLEKLNNLYVPSLPAPYANRLHPGVAAVCKEKQHLVLLSPALSKLINVESPKVRKQVSLLFVELSAALLKSEE
mmetsp:Transcript_26226/g.42473  ORF Transcript_26226/g.42473 Transcript_26226/m.42473 type:complete len:1818 (+) Transcript_26226:92-5545(+)